MRKTAVVREGETSGSRSLEEKVGASSGNFSASKGKSWSKIVFRIFSYIGESVSESVNCHKSFPGVSTKVVEGDERCKEEPAILSAL